MKMPRVCTTFATAALATLLLGTTPGASAQPAGASPSVAQLHALAMNALRQGRHAEAYGRLMRLADAGHVRSAEAALWMYRHGPTVFGADWDVSPDQLEDWARLTGQPATPMVEHVTRSPADQAPAGRR